MKAISEMNPPTNPKGVREFLGMVDYYTKFINRFADPVSPLTKLTKRDVKFGWSPDCQAGFEYERTHTQITQPEEEVYSIHGHLRSSTCSCVNTKVPK